MAELTKETIKHLTELCRIDCTAEEQASILSDLQKILHYIEKLNEIDTSHVKPCIQVLEDVSNITRPDEIGEVLDRTKFLANAPAHVGGMIRVPPVLKQQ